MKCNYCGTPIENGQFCSQDHKKRYTDRLQDAINVHCPPITGRNLEDKHRELQEEWKKKNKGKAKKQCLVV